MAWNQFLFQRQPLEILYRTMADAKLLYRHREWTASSPWFTIFYNQMEPNTISDLTTVTTRNVMCLCLLISITCVNPWCMFEIGLPPASITVFMNGLRFSPTHSRCLCFDRFINAFGFHVFGILFCVLDLQRFSTPLICKLFFLNRIVSGLFQCSHIVANLLQNCCRQKMFPSSPGPIALPRPWNWSIPAE